MAVSAPSVNRPIPTMSMTAPKRKASSISAVTGTTVESNSSTMPVTGNTDDRDSDIFGPSIVLPNIFFNYDIPLKTLFLHIISCLTEKINRKKDLYLLIDNILYMCYNYSRIRIDCNNVFWERNHTADNGKSRLL